MKRGEQIRDLIAAWYDRYREVFGEKPLMNTTAAAGIIRLRLRDGLKYEELDRLMLVFFARCKTGDKWLTKDASLTRFLSASMLENLRGLERGTPAAREAELIARVKRVTGGGAALLLAIALLLPACVPGSAADRYEREEHKAFCCGGEEP